ncbi:excisionase family DNA-binding protein [Weizmannia coagulans]|jgi:excisionase family DNA binding protein|uniref:Helix-turn-helix domain-containing protein n=2 Tax=Heyndrickxia TaxID=2837504 RepID=A0AAN0T3W7_HEYCO|nr:MULTISPECIES: excisionase family DNA-binding protein [Heyndrickxia]AJO21564.1 hypothetical protein SB48_HM08orf01186 [Heyndrickxia coagulans]AKN52818.1 DNA binding domain, excisionase family [Heyndrickxia coagulans]ATW82108.1 hypothetical protein CIW84_03335 [Heyndrickxia coagulans]KGB29439.1 hypothetical protein IE89_11075 [Heyndrickxia coagulans]KGT39585.1 hypothetical protein P421_04170 [Heyndrickxia coagulans P38]
MYLTIQETAEYLSFPEPVIEKLILQRRIRAVHDGEQYLINRDQFDIYLQQLEKYRQLVEEWLNEPLPEDPDIKDED